MNSLLIIIVYCLICSVDKAICENSLIFYGAWAIGWLTAVAPRANQIEAPF